VVRNVLDVGCGDGHFLAIFAEKGCSTYGTEFDHKSAIVAESKGVRMLEGGLLPDLPADISGFDVIVFTEVIEHINIPRTVINHFVKLLNPGGLLFITTPNFDGLERLMIEPDWGMIMYPEHISYYSPRTLDKIVTSCGLIKLRTHTENISIFRVVQFFNRFRKVGKIDPEKVSARAQTLASDNKIVKLVKNSLNVILRLTNLGSSIVAVYQKP
jgi:2-polyprenyl-3-methyl-5-hydroxy-6-metoxy-1,4-benzoquinol methylase